MNELEGGEFKDAAGFLISVPNSAGTWGVSASPAFIVSSKPSLLM